MNLPSVSVVMPTYNRCSELPAVIDAVIGNAHVSEIVVVVDGCDDGSIEYLRHRAVAEPRLKPVWQENQGESFARRTGVDTATSDVVLVLDDDVVASPDLALGHARHHVDGDASLVLGYMPTTRPVPRRPGQFATFLYAEEYERACMRYERDTAAVLGHLWAGNMSMRRSDAVVAFAELPERLGYHDDQVFGLRCLELGMTGHFDRRLRATHVHSRSPGAFVGQAVAMGRARRAINETSAASDWTDPYQQAGLPMRMLAALGLLGGLEAVAGVALRLAGAAHMWSVETRTAKLIRRSAVLRGYRETSPAVEREDIST